MSSSNKQHRHTPTSRDQVILEHVARYRLTTLEVLGRTVLPGLSRNALNKITNRLCEAGLLQKYTLLHPVRYFVLGDWGARGLGFHEYRAHALGPQSLPQEFAILSFATLGAKPHLRLTTAEVLLRCPWLPSVMASAPHCIDRAEVLELIRVDLGGPADHVARKSALDLVNRLRISEFPPLVADGRFRFVVITSTSGKARRLLPHVPVLEQPHDRNRVPKSGPGALPPDADLNQPLADFMNRSSRHDGLPTVSGMSDLMHMRPKARRTASNVA